MTVLCFNLKNDITHRNRIKYSTRKFVMTFIKYEISSSTSSAYYRVLLSKYKDFVPSFIVSIDVTAAREDAVCRGGNSFLIHLTINGLRIVRCFTVISLPTLKLVGRKDTRISDIFRRRVAGGRPKHSRRSGSKRSFGCGRGRIYSRFVSRQTVGKEADARLDEIATRYARVRPGRLH